MALIDGADVPGDGPDRVLVDPATGQPVASIADCTVVQVDAAVAAARAALPAWSAPDARRAGPGAAAPRGPGGAARGRAHRARGRGVRQAAGDDARRRAALRGRQPALLRGRRPLARGDRRGGAAAGYTSMLLRRPVGVVGSHRALELPAHHGGLEAGPGAGGGQHRGHQARIRGPRARRCCLADAWSPRPALPPGSSTWSPAAPTSARRW